MSRNVKVSIVVPVYGVEKYIHTFLDSIKAQTFEDLEVIFVDDGSPDNCPAILDEFVKTDDRYSVIHQVNSGVSAARNNGIEKAVGEYVYIADSDDWLEPDAIEVLYNGAKLNNADIVYADWIKETDSETKRKKCFPDEFYTEDSYSIKLLQCAVNTSNEPTTYKSSDFASINHVGGAPWEVLIRRSLIVENSLRFDPRVKGVGDDILFMLNLYEYVSSVQYVQEPIYHYRIVDTSITHGYKPAFINTSKPVLKEIAKFIKDNNKDSIFIESYYIRVILYIDKYMSVYFKNVNNEKSSSELYKEFKKLLKTGVYRKAIKKAPVKLIKRKSIRALILFSRLHLYRLYWILKK